MRRVQSESIREKIASTSPLANRSGGFSRFQRTILAKPCCGPNVHGPNCAVIMKNQFFLNGIRDGILTKHKGDAAPDSFLPIKNRLFAENKRVFFGG